MPRQATQSHHQGELTETQDIGGAGTVERLKMALNKGWKWIDEVSAIESKTGWPGRVAALTVERTA